MTGKDFYASGLYRSKQSEKTKLNWLSGRMDFLRKSMPRRCARSSCTNRFTSIPSDPKRYCSSQCAAVVNNSGRMLSQVTKIRISRALTGKSYPDRKAPAKFSTCVRCNKKFVLRFWRPKSHPIKYCSRICAIRDVGSRPTSPRAARAKAGIRNDISPPTYFFSRWEANYARLLNYRGVKWIHQPKTFQLKSQKYTPDFYLPEVDTYIEIKNYLSDYSKNRDRQFREMYPELKLVLILKEDYLGLQKEYAPKIKEWEHNNSPTN